MGIFVAVGTMLFAGVVAITLFWEKVEKWLNKYAAAIVEKAFGYKARDKMQGAIVKVGRVVDKIRQSSTIFIKENPWDDYFTKTEVEAEAPMTSVDEDVIKKINQRGELTQEFKYELR